MSPASTCAHEPGLRFWLRYAEHQGALVEDGGDHALTVLPDWLQEAAQLPEEFAVTSDPDVAGEDGAVLMIPGHPALERAAASVLDEGDVGRLYLPWPASTPGTASSRLAPGSTSTSSTGASTPAQTRGVPTCRWCGWAR